MLPAGRVEGLERLVDEVERVAAVQVAVVGRRREEHVGQLLPRGPGANRRDERPLRAVGVAHLDEAAEPTPQPLGLQVGARQRIEREPRWLHRRIGGDIGKAVIEGGGALVTLQPREQVHQARERRQPTEPAATPPQRAELEPGAKGVGAAGVSLGEPDRRLGENERDVPPQPVVQALPLVRERVHRRRQIDVDVVALDLHREPAQVVRPLVERATGAQVEARVVPVAGEDPVGDRAAMERKAHVRTAIVDGVDLAALREQADRVAVEVDDEPAGRVQLVERGGASALCGHYGHRDKPRTSSMV